MTDKPPAPVEVTNPDPIAVKVDAPVEVTNPDPIAVKVDAPADTTAQTTAKTVAAAVRSDAEILRTEDQRRISGIWEGTQRIIALSVVEMTLVVVSLLVIAPSVGYVFGATVPEAATTAATAGMIFLASVANLVIGFYFGRTNHQRVGGTPSDRDDYLGR